MTATSTKKLFDQVASWPEADQQELADYARVIEARRVGTYRVSADERSAIEEGLAQADRGEFASEEEMAKLDQKL